MRRGETNTSFCEEFFKVAVGESVSEVPADSQHDHLGREPETNERRTIHRGRLVMVMIHPETLARHEADPSTQHCC